jgi:hypothetical protein
MKLIFFQYILNEIHGPATQYPVFMCERPQVKDNGDTLRLHTGSTERVVKNLVNLLLKRILKA